MNILSLFKYYIPLFFVTSLSCIQLHALINLLQSIFYRKRNKKKSNWIHGCMFYDLKAKFEQQSNWTSFYHRLNCRWKNVLWLWRWRVHALNGYVLKFPCKRAVHTHRQLNKRKIQSKKIRKGSCLKVVSTRAIAIMLDRMVTTLAKLFKGYRNKNKFVKPTT